MSRKPSGFFTKGKGPDREVHPTFEPQGHKAPEGKETNPGRASRQSQQIEQLTKGNGAQVEYEVIIGGTVRTGASAKTLTEATNQMRKLRKQWPNARAMKIIKLRTEKDGTTYLEGDITYEKPPKNYFSRRTEIMNTPEFREWWYHRSQEYPLPTDPFQAYMTDVSLRARRHGIEPWEDEPNRFDIDADWPPYFNRERPRDIPRKHRKRAKRLERERKTFGKPRYTTPTREKYQKLADEITERYKVPKVTVITHEKEGPLMSYARQEFRYDRHSREYTPVHTEIHIGTVGSEKTVQAAFKHEVGHHVEMQQRFRKQGRLFSRTHPEGTLASERDAWRVAKPYMKFSEEHWLRRFAIETYMKNGRVRMTDVSEVGKPYNPLA